MKQNHNTDTKNKDTKNPLELFVAKRQFSIQNNP